MNKILITGCRGMIGSRLYKKIPNSIGIDIRDGLDILSADLPKKVDTIYHLAAQTSVQASWYDPVNDSKNLSMITRLVKEYPSAKIIYASSAATKEPISSPYGFSKWAAGEFLKRFHQNYVICVFANVYGEKGGKSVVDIFKESESLEIYGDGFQVRDFVHVDDIVDGLLLSKSWKIGEYLMGTGEKTSILDLARHTKKEIKFLPSRLEARESILSNTTPNWIPKIKVMDYL